MSAFGNLSFAAFVKILVLAASFSCSKFYLKTYSKIVFPVFGRILVLVAVFFPVAILIKKGVGKFQLTFKKENPSKS